MRFPFSTRINRLKKSLSRRLTEARLPRGYERLGTRYGGWWIDTSLISRDPLVIDCGLGEDISFPSIFLKKFGGRVIGIEPNPKSHSYCEKHMPEGMEMLPRAFWIKGGEKIDFYPPADCTLVSGSLHKEHTYAGEKKFSVLTTNFNEVLAYAGRDGCDVLKMDIEGAEYEVLADLCRTGAITKASQVMVEFHHRCIGRVPEDTLKSVRDMEEKGFKLIYIEGEKNYIFRKTDLLTKSFDTG